MLSSIFYLLFFTLLLVGCRSKASDVEPAEDAENVEPLPERAPMIVEGEQIYATHCVGCHQADGDGIANLYPPLTGADTWLTGDPERAVKIVLHGMSGELRMNGQVYNQVMPAFGQLSDEEVAAVLTYARQSWGNEGSVVDARDVRRVRNDTDGRARPWSPDELE